MGRTPAASLLLRLQQGQDLSLQDQTSLALQLSLPAILSQFSTLFMEFVDAAMVGSLGASSSASLGLVASSLWLFHGISIALCLGFSVQAAQYLGARDEESARSVCRQGLLFVFLFALALGGLGLGISPFLPGWLGAEAAIRAGASSYFALTMWSLPAFLLKQLSASLLQAAGNMRTPSSVNLFSCLLNIVLNALLIFPSRIWLWGSWSVFLPGAGLGITGAALGTALSELVAALLLLVALLARSVEFNLRRGDPLQLETACLRRAFRIAYPIAMERAVLSGAQIALTRIVAPLGMIAISAHSFATTAEGLCYMPGYGVQQAATMLVGQSVGARRKDLAYRLAWLSTGLGVMMMTLIAFLMYGGAPYLMALLTPVPEIQALGTTVLRIEAFAEPLFAASIVATGAMRGAGDTLLASVLGFSSMWLVRLPLAFLLAPRIGLRGVWLAMCVELNVRGALFLLGLRSKRWLDKSVIAESQENKGGCSCV